MEKYFGVVHSHYCRNKSFINDSIKIILNFYPSLFFLKKKRNNEEKISENSEIFIKSIFVIDFFLSINGFLVNSLENFRNKFFRETMRFSFYNHLF